MVFPVRIFIPIWCDSAIQYNEIYYVSLGWAPRDPLTAG